MGFRVPKAKRWEQGIIRYTFQTDPKKPLPDGRLKGFFVACMRQWERFINIPDPLIQFVPWEGEEKPYLLIDLTDFSDKAQSSCPIGKPDGKFSKFTFNLYRPDEYKSIPHELGHCLGLAHEHLRNNPADLATWQRNDDPHLYPTNDMQVLSQSGARNRYEAHGDYDLLAISHYPKAGGWSWSREAWNNAMNEHLVLDAVNYPTPQEIEDDTWWLSADDIATIQDLYRAP